MVGSFYASFPVPTKAVRADDFRTSDASDPDADSGLIWATLEWLEETGYIRSKSKAMGRQMHSVTLRPKALEALRAVPNSIDPEQTIGEGLVEASRSGTRDAVRRLASESLTAIF